RTIIMKSAQDLYEHLIRSISRIRVLGMVRVQCTVGDHRMPALAPTPNMVPMIVITHVKFGHAHEVTKQKYIIKKHEVINAKYPDPVHQKEVYQESMEVIRNLK
ncbi:hypothetical protein KI387_036995, partial [Taxus chinensis]